MMVCKGVLYSNCAYLDQPILSCSNLFGNSSHYYLILDVQATLCMAIGPYLWFWEINNIPRGPQIKVQITVSMGGYPKISGIRAKSSRKSYDHIIQYIYFIYFLSSRCFHKRNQIRHLPSIQRMHRSMVYVSRPNILQQRRLSRSSVAYLLRLDVK